MRASFGMTKYCSFFLRKIQCPNSDCLYLHEVARERDCYNKDENFSTRNILKVDQMGIIDHVLKINPNFVKKKEDFEKFNKEPTIFPNINTAIRKIKNYYEKNIKKIEIKKVVKNVKTSKKAKKICSKNKIKNFNIQKWDEEEDSIPELFSPLKNEISDNQFDEKPDFLFKSNDFKENELYNSNEKKNNAIIKNSQQFENFLTKEDKKNTNLKSKKTKKISKIKKVEKKLSENENDSTMDTKDEMIKNENSLNKKIEEILKKNEKDFTNMDKLILKSLNKSYIRLQRKKSRYKFVNENNLNLESSNDRFLNIKNLINKFLGKDLEFLIKKNDVKKKDINKDENFRLFGQTYNFNFQKEVYYKMM